MKPLKAKKAKANQKRKKNRNILVIGLGNPGLKYGGTRHNAGFAVADLLIEKYQIQTRKPFMRPVEYGSTELNGKGVYIAKPLTFMNLSGKVTDYLVKKSGTDIEDIVVVCDNMDLETGTLRVKKGGSDAGHNGLKSLIAFLGSSAFIRIYIGIGRPQDGGNVVDHVLGEFNVKEREKFRYAVEKAAAAVRDMTARSLSEVMNETNKRDS